MGFFRFTNPSPANTQGEDLRPIVLQLNEEEIRIPASEAAGKSIEQLFDEHAADLGDTNRISRFVAAGQIVSGHDAAKPGTIYRGVSNSETKGA